MSYQVLARKWRPGNFLQMVGQEHVLQALINALDSGRLHHAYLFSGTRGVGKTTIARIFAKSLNCDEGVSSTPCNICPSCREIDEGRSVDLIEIDAASRTGVDDMRELLDNVQYAPTRGRFKVYLIDEVHMLSRHSFNALLKTLEEPPGHVKFLLATTDPQKLPVTVLSRCLQFHLKRMTKQQINSHLEFLLGEESVTYNPDAVVQLSSAADGSMRDALSLLDQAIAFGAGTVELTAVESMLGTVSREYLTRLLSAIVSQDGVSILRESRNIMANNPDFLRVCAELIAVFQQLAIVKVDPQIESEGWLSDAVDNCKDALTMAEIQLYYQLLLQGRQDLSISPDPAAGFEMLMLRLLAFAPEKAVADSREIEVKKNTEIRSAANFQSSEPSDKTPIDHVDVYTDSDLALTSVLPAVAKIETPRQTAQVIEVISTPEQDFAAVQATVDLQLTPPMLVPHLSDSKPLNPWAEKAFCLGLQGLSLEIAVSCLFDRSENNVRLLLPRELQDLVSAAVRSELENAIYQEWGNEINLSIELVDRLDQETPKQAKSRLTEEARQQAIIEIRNDELVRKLQQTLGAELVESSVQLKNPN
ncbi:MAG: DNA polymerase-3 subunit gamma/tau [Gammaproteobacteria bacterium]|jgi:DNA polymerase-3 subunit gamma/tau